MGVFLKLVQVSKTASICLCLAALPFENVQASVGFVSTERILKGSKAASDIESANREVRALSQERSIYLVFQEAVYVSPRVDITDQVLARLEGRLVRALVMPSSIQLAMVSTERILRESSAAKSAQLKLEAEFAKRERQVQELAKRLRESSEMLVRDSPSITQEARAKQQRDISNMERDLQRRQGEFREDLNRRRNAELATRKTLQIGSTPKR